MQRSAASELHMVTSVLRAAPGDAPDCVKTLDFENEGDKKSLPGSQKYVISQMWGTDFLPFSISRVFTQSREALDLAEEVGMQAKRYGYEGPIPERWSRATGAATVARCILAVAR